MYNSYKTKKRIKRRKTTNEFFTPDSLVNEMLAKLPDDCWEDGKTFCDPACGNGQFLVWVLAIKLSKGHEPLEALKTIYGVDIMQDNINECRLRLLKVISLLGQVTSSHNAAVRQNIFWTCDKKGKYRNGALDYDFSFPNKIKWADVEDQMDKIENHHLLSAVEIPKGIYELLKVPYPDYEEPYDGNLDDEDVEDIDNARSDGYQDLYPD